MPKNYLTLWTNAYGQYTKFANYQDKDYPCNSGGNTSLTGRLEEENKSLARDLGYLDSYYAEIDRFMTLAKFAKTNPDLRLDPSTTVHQALDSAEENLCSDDTLWPYYYGYIGGQRVLASIAESVDAYSRIRANFEPQLLVGSEIIMLLNMLSEIKSLSNKVRYDWQDEIKGSGTNAFVAYKDGRKQTLVALRAAGGSG